MCFLALKLCQDTLWSLAALHGASVNLTDASGLRGCDGTLVRGGDGTRVRGGDGPDLETAAPVAATDLRDASQREACYDDETTRRARAHLARRFRLVARRRLARECGVCALRDQQRRDVTPPAEARCKERRRAVGRARVDVDAMITLLVLHEWAECEDDLWSGEGVRWA